MYPEDPCWCHARAERVFLYILARGHRSEIGFDDLVHLVRIGRRLRRQQEQLQDVIEVEVFYGHGLYAVEEGRRRARCEGDLLDDVIRIDASLRAGDIDHLPRVQSGRVGIKLRLPQGVFVRLEFCQGALTRHVDVRDRRILDDLLAHSIGRDRCRIGWRRRRRVFALRRGMGRRNATAKAQSRAFRSGEAGD